MNSLIIAGNGGHQADMTLLCILAMKKHEKTCYITFNESYQVVIGMLVNSPVDEKKFIIVDASTQTKKRVEVNEQTVVIPINDLFNVYMFLHNLIKQEGISHILVDSISSLINKHSELPLKEMLSDLLLEVGQMNCDTSIVVSRIHTDHEVVNHIRPLINNNITL